MPISREVKKMVDKARAERRRNEILSNAKERVSKKAKSQKKHK